LRSENKKTPWKLLRGGVEDIAACITKANGVVYDDYAPHNTAPSKEQEECYRMLKLVKEVGMNNRGLQSENEVLKNKVQNISNLLHAIIARRETRSCDGDNVETPNADMVELLADEAIQEVMLAKKAAEEAEKTRAADAARKKQVADDARTADLLAKATSNAQNAQRIKKKPTVAAKTGNSTGTSGPSGKKKQQPPATAEVDAEVLLLRVEARAAAVEERNAIIVALAGEDMLGQITEVESGNAIMWINKLLLTLDSLQFLPADAPCEDDNADPVIAAASALLRAKGDTWKAYVAMCKAIVYNIEEFAANGTLNVALFDPYPKGDGVPPMPRRRVPQTVYNKLFKHAGVKAILGENHDETNEPQNWKMQYIRAGVMATVWPDFNRLGVTLPNIATPYSHHAAISATQLTLLYRSLDTFLKFAYCDLALVNINSEAPIKLRCNILTAHLDPQQACDSNACPLCRIKVAPSVEPAARVVHHASPAVHPVAPTVQPAPPVATQAATRRYPGNPTPGIPCGCDADMICTH
jgi:hypothetical protein